MSVSKLGLAAAIACVGCGTVDKLGTPVVAQIATTCGVAPEIQWTAIAGASYTLSYGMAGNLTTIELAAGTTSYQPELPPGSYVVHIQAHLGSDDGPVSPDTSFQITGTAGQFTQTTSGDFGANVDMFVDSGGDQVQLGTDLATGNGTTALTVSTNTSLAGGTYAYTNVTIAVGATLTITGNTPFVIQASGTVMIAGTINANGAVGNNGVTSSSFGLGGAGGPGGAAGGNGVLVGSPANGAPGLGLGGGGAGVGWSGGGGGSHAVAAGTCGSSNGGCTPGAVYGTSQLTTLEGGSGGGGGSGGNNCGSGGGGGGGGSVRIDAPTIAIGLTGAIHADGGAGGTDGNGSCGGGGGGSGGSIQLRADNLTIAGTVSASGGAGGNSSIPGTPYYGVGAAGAVGRIRLDATTASIGSGTLVPTPGVDGPLGSSTLSGSTITAAIAPTALCAWGTITYDDTVPTNTTLEVDVLDDAGAVIAPNVASGTNLSTMIPAATASVKLQALLATTTSGVSPILNDWTLSYVTQ